MNNKNLVLERYLKEISSDTMFELSKITIISLIATLYYIMIYVSISKPDKELSDKLYSITGKRYIVKLVKSSSHNAFCFGGFTNHIFVTTGLIKLLNERELISVLLHEVSHITTFDSIQTFISNVARITLISRMLTVLIPKLKFGNFKFLPVFVILSIIGLSFAPGFLLGRYHELKSDKYTIKYGYGNDLITAFEKFKELEEKEMNKYDKLNQSVLKIQKLIDVHPSFDKRIDKLVKNIALYDYMIENNKNKVKELVTKELTIEA